MTRWVIKCTRCGLERELDVGFDLTPFRNGLYIYCTKCRMNTFHVVLGYHDPYTGEYRPIEAAGEEQIHEFD